MGSSTERFKLSQVGIQLGPGQYNHDIQNIRKEYFQIAGSSSFMVPSRSRENPLVNKSNLEIPGPGEYKIEDSMRFLKTQRAVGKTAFVSNIDRFKRHIEEVPGPG